jgi:hypothetical protein
VINVTPPWRRDRTGRPCSGRGGTPTGCQAHHRQGRDDLGERPGSGDVARARRSRRRRRLGAARGFRADRPSRTQHRVRARHRWTLTRLEGAGLIGYGVLWLAEAGLIAIVIRLQVPTPAELLRDVATRPVIWIGASVVLSVQQVLLVVVVPALGRVVGPSTVAADDGGRRIGSMAAEGGTGHRGRRRLVSSATCSSSAGSSITSSACSPRPALCCRRCGSPEPAALAGASPRDHPPVKDPLALHRRSREWPARRTAVRRPRPASSGNDGDPRLQSGCNPGGVSTPRLGVAHHAGLMLRGWPSRCSRTRDPCCAAVMPSGPGSSSC